MGLVQGGLFLVVAFAVSLFAAFPKFAAFGKVSPLAALLFIALTGFFAGIIAAIGGINGGRKAWLEGKIILTDSEKELARNSKAPVAPLWLLPLGHDFLQLLLFTGIAAAISFLAFPQGMSRWVFVPLCTLAIGLHSGLLAPRAA